MSQLIVSSWKHALIGEETSLKLFFLEILKSKPNVPEEPFYRGFLTAVEDGQYILPVLEEEEVKNEKTEWAQNINNISYLKIE